MADKQKNSKQGRQKKSGQNMKYKNEFRREQNKLERLKAHIRAHGVTKEVLERVRLLQIALGHAPSNLTVNRPKDRSPASAAFHRRPDAKMHMAQMRSISLSAR